mmetsp:Transcript_28471/g.73124  ORF Transcript_28471/g.73124 Transcript_28471/m.73124 type:complete len:258 (-) Transcript_28471:1159-1932(-)
MRRHPMKGAIRVTQNYAAPRLFGHAGSLRLACRDDSELPLLRLVLPVLAAVAAAPVRPFTRLLVIFPVAILSAVLLVPLALLALRLRVGMVVPPALALAQAMLAVVRAGWAAAAVPALLVALLILLVAPPFLLFLPAGLLSCLGFQVVEVLLQHALPHLVRLDRLELRLALKRLLHRLPRALRRHRLGLLQHRRKRLGGRLAALRLLGLLVLGALDLLPRKQLPVRLRNLRKRLAHRPRKRLQDRLLRRVGCHRHAA